MKIIEIRFWWLFVQLANCDHQMAVNYRMSSKKQHEIICGAVQFNRYLFLDFTGQAVLALLVLMYKLEEMALNIHFSC